MRFTDCHIGRHGSHFARLALAKMYLEVSSDAGLAKFYARVTPIVSQVSTTVGIEPPPYRGSQQNIRTMRDATGADIAL